MLVNEIIIVQKNSKVSCVLGYFITLTVLAKLTASSVGLSFFYHLFMIYTRKGTQFILTENFLEVHFSSSRESYTDFKSNNIGHVMIKNTIHIKYRTQKNNI